MDKSSCTQGVVDNLWITAECRLLWVFRHTTAAVDLSNSLGYNTYMLKKTTTTAAPAKAPRKKRVDRSHIIYELRLPCGGNYIGVTAKTESTILKSVRVRANKHWYRAMKEDKSWSLCAALREMSCKEEIEIVVHEVVRGKPDAHKREVEIRRAVKPTLNTDVRGDVA